MLKRCDALWSPMAWRSFKMSQTVPSSCDALWSPMARRSFKMSQTAPSSHEGSSCRRSVPALADGGWPPGDLSGCCVVTGPCATEEEDENSGQGGGGTCVHSATTHWTSRQFRDRSFSEKSSRLEKSCNDFWEASPGGLLCGTFPWP